MKKVMPFIVAGALLAGSACSTYSSSTDPDDLGSGWGLSDNKSGTGNTSSFGVAEANNNATFDNAETQQTKQQMDSSAVPQTKKANASENASTSAPVKVSTGQDH